MRLLVQKFGGSSLATQELRQQVVEHIVTAKQAGWQVVVVVSAIGRQGDAYATDTLLDFLYQLTTTPPPREKDLLLACGEIIAAAVTAAAVNEAGEEAVALTGWQAGIITDGAFGQAEIVKIKKERILRHLQDNQTVIVAGFQGISDDAEITTLGRGGSDTSAVALGAALNAELVEIYSDVDTVMTADPRLVPEAQPIKNIGYQEVLQMAHQGAKVIHPRAVDLALQYNLPLLLKKTGASAPGTLITHHKLGNGQRLRQSSNVVTGITHTNNLAQVCVQAPSTDGYQLEELLKKLSSAGISIDLINFSPQEKMFTVSASHQEKVKQILQELGYKAQVAPGFAKVTVVGSGMRGIPGVMARIVSALNKAQTPILQTADSHLNISCLVAEDNVTAAARALHLEFGLHEDSI
ncbi:MAG TPA: aspartate kinase [Oscillospiraceae bacterium]|nr:aspartate kinase [Oscillospiraceae bacterium]